MANQQTQQRQDNRQQATAIAQLAPSRLPITEEFAKQMGVTPAQWRVLVDQTFPAAKSVEAVHMALSYCKHRNLDIFKKPVHIVPVYSSLLRRMVETVWPGISELRTTASRTKSYAGLSEPEFGPKILCEFTQTIESDDPRASPRVIKHSVAYPEWCKMTAWRMVDGVRCAFTAQVFWTETYATAGRNTDMPNEMWRKRPYGQIDKCAEAAVLRKAFPEEIGNEYAAEEMQGRVIDDDSIPVAPMPENHAAPRTPPRASQQQQGDRPTNRPSEQRAAGTGNAPAQKETRQAARGERVKPEPEQGRFDTIIDGEVNPPDNGDEFPGDRKTGNDKNAAAFLSRLEKALNACEDEGTFNVTWDDFDAMAVLDGDEAGQRRALEIKAKAYGRMYGEA